MGQLRRKLEADPARPQHLRTEPGMGYRFEP
jgi:two-component system KDP operon response regulator KdpE